MQMIFLKKMGKTIPENVARLMQECLKLLKPPPKMTLSEWADEYRMLSGKSSNEAGRWRTDRAPYQKEPMDAITNPRTRKVVLMWAAQMGKTDSMILNTCGYFMHRDPAPIMVLQPTVEMAETVSKQRYTPMVNDTPVLSKIIGNKTRDGNNTIQEKSFPGGYIVFIGANSPASLASRPIRILLADEIDRYPKSAGKEGSPLLLAEKRQTTFWNKKEVVTSTPTIKNDSPIETEYEASTQEVWNVPCPSCGEYQPLQWSGVKFDAEGIREGTNTEVFYECAYCKTVSTETEWRLMQSKGKYVPTFPEREVRGFFVNGLSSPFTEWKNIAADFVKATDDAKKGDKEALKAWTNLNMAQTWDEAGEQIDTVDLIKRLEDYGCEVPLGVRYITIGVDTQDDRFEYEVKGWGTGYESWGIEKGAIYGDLKEKDVWNRLDEKLLQTWERADGTLMSPVAACIDSGGHFANEVYRFCLARWDRNVWAIKGRGDRNGQPTPYISNPSRNNRVKVPLFTLGVDTGKRKIYNRLRITEPGPGYCHFPSGDRGYDDMYFKGLTAEKLISTYKEGRVIQRWVLKDSSFRRNEPLDITNYAQAAVEIAHLNLEPEEKRMKKSTRRRRQISGGVV